MGTKTIITRETKDDKDLPDNNEPEPTAADVELAEFMGSLPEEIVIKIYKMQHGEKAYCGRAEPAIVNENYLYRNFGGGRYHLWGMKNNKFVAGTHRIINIYEPDVSPAEIAGNLRELPDESHEENGSNLTHILLSQIKQQHETMLELIRTQGNGQKTDMADLVQLAQLLNQNKSPDAMTALPSIMELVKTVMETSRDFAGGEDPKMAWANLGLKVLDKLPATMGQILQGKAMQRAAAQGQEIQPDQVDALLKRGITWLKNQCEKGNDPGFVADMVLANMDDPAYKTLAVNLTNVPFDDFGKIDPEIVKMPMRSWFVEVYNNLHKALQYDEENKVDAGPGGSVTDIEANEEPGDTGDTYAGPPESGNADN